MKQRHPKQAGTGHQPVTITPTEDEFLALAERGNLVPVYREILADVETPVSAFQKLGRGGGAFLLESVEGGEHLGRYSFVGAHPRAVLRSVGNTVIVREGRQETRYRLGEGKFPEPLSVLEAVMARYRPVALPGLPRFCGGAVGFLNYEYVHFIEPTVPRPKRGSLGVPDLNFMIADSVLIFDRVSQTLKIVCNALVEEPRQAALVYRATVRKIEEIMRRLRASLKRAACRPLDYRRQPAPVPFKSNLPRERFDENVSRSHEYIKAGDIIQAVLSQRFSAPVKAGALEVYRALRSVNPSPYMFLFDFGDLQLVGGSPEVHVRCEEGKVEIRPIAGTRPRGPTADKDAALEKELLASPKERAEHLMLVDLARNDIGRVCDYGSVRVPEFMVIERYSHVMHIVSGVEGRLQRGKTVYDLMRATFPAGTVSGAPKVRAMQIISELENCQRGPYAGAVGYFSFNGNLDSCITIRTALLKEGRAYVQAGGGYVLDSTAAGEFQESVNKAKAMMKAVALAEGFAAGPGRGGSRP